MVQVMKKIIIIIYFLNYNNIQMSNELSNFDIIDIIKDLFCVFLLPLKTYCGPSSETIQSPE
jgi:hypothetical protein